MHENYIGSYACKEVCRQFARLRISVWLGGCFEVENFTTQNSLGTFVDVTELPDTLTLSSIVDQIYS